MNIKQIINEEIRNLNENIRIPNPSTDYYNEIFIGDKKVGYIVLSPARKEYYWLDFNFSNPLALVDIKIFPEFRNQGIMKNTINWLHDFAKQQGFSDIILRVDEDSEVSAEDLKRIYSGFGYREFDAGEDIFMFKNL